MNRFRALLDASAQTPTAFQSRGPAPPRAQLAIFGRPGQADLRCACGELLVPHGHMDMGTVAGRWAIRVRLIHPLPLCAAPECTSPGLPRSAVVEIIPARPVLGGGPARPGGPAQIETRAVVPRRR